VSESNQPSDAVQVLRDEFRQHLERFYAQLKLAPPYHSLEKAVALLATKLKAMKASEREVLLVDPVLRWKEFGEAFAESGLNRKHRGIIARLRRSPLQPTLPQEYEYFLKSFSPE
jgi:hypothetical protein